LNQLSLFGVDVEPCGDWVAEFHGYIAEGFADANLIPWRFDSCPIAAIANVRAALEAEGWTWNESEKQLERGGWYVWFRSQGRLSSPIAQWNKLKGE
jgi:hypothetical protein